MNEAVREIAGLRTLVAGAADAPLELMLMHGYGMRPEGPIAAAAGGFGLTGAMKRRSLCGVGCASSCAAC
jgi:hypothetical protein